MLSSCCVVELNNKNPKLMEKCHLNVTVNAESRTLDVKCLVF